MIDRLSPKQPVKNQKTKKKKLLSANQNDNSKEERQIDLLGEAAGEWQCGEEEEKKKNYIYNYLDAANGMPLTGRQ